MSDTQLPDREMDILLRVIIPDERYLSEHLARAILGWTFDGGDQRRVDELATKAREGTFTADDSVELDAYERISSFLGVLKSKVRQAQQAC